MAQRYFTPALFTFIKDLKENNDREWFHENKARYEDVVREPAKDFIDAFATPLAKITEHFVADTRSVGGSLFRIHRDTRFSKDKTPYKTHVGIHFRHMASRDNVHAPGMYVHLEPGACFVGAGLWRPATADAYKIREAIADDPGRWKRATRSKAFTDVYTIDGDSLKRPPKGFDPEHALIEDLKRKDFMATTKITQKLVTSEEFLPEYVKLVKKSAPLMRFLCDAVGVPF
jgi:uncharacterized protein (TIGR02453 family)